MLTHDTHQEILRLQRQLDAAQRISQALFQQNSLDHIVEKALDIALDVSDAEAGSVLLAANESEQLVFHYSIGHVVASGTAMPWSEGIAGAVFHSGVPEVIQKVTEDPRHFLGIGAIDGFITRDLIAVPLKQWEGRPIGVLEILNKRRGLLSEEDLHILTVIATFTALAIEQNRLLKEAKLGEIARLVGEIGHDVNNMLTPMMLCAPDMEKTLKDLFGRLSQVGITAEEKTHEECNGFFEMMRNSLRRIQERAKLIADCVKGHIAAPHFQACNLDSIVKNVLDALRIVAEQKGITLRTEGIAGLPVLWADETRLYNAFYNLINNAIPEVPPAGSITITGQLEPGIGFIHLAVADTGRGMPPDIRDSLFSANAISRKPGGTGLGTKIVKDVIDAHGGQITVESTEHVGTTFHLRLPIRPPGFGKEMASAAVLPQKSDH